MTFWFLVGGTLGPRKYWDPLEEILATRMSLSLVICESMITTLGVNSDSYFSEKAADVLSIGL